MAYRELELTLLSAQELKSVNLITRMDVYAVVSISNDPLTRQCTEPDNYGGRNPCWNATFRFAVPPTSTAAATSSASLHVLLRAERFLGDRDVGEVVIPLSDILAGATGVGPQPPQVASYQVRKLHRREPRGVLNVQYRLGPVVAPVVERTAPEKQPAYAPPVGVPPPTPYHQHPSYYPAPPPALGPPVGRAVAVHDEAAQKKSPVMAYPAVGVPQQQQASHAPAKQDAYRPPPSPSPSPPPPRPVAVHAARHEEARRAPTPPPAPAPTPPGPTHFHMGPYSQIIFGGAHTTASSGPPTRTTSPARSIISPGGKKGDGNWALHTQGGHASAADSMSVSVLSPRSRKEDRWRPNGLSQSQHDTQQQQQEASSPVAAAPSPHRLAAAASPFSSRSSSFSSPLSPYSSAHPSPSPSSAHSSTRSPYSAYSAHPSLNPPTAGGAAEVTHGTNNTFRSTSSRGSTASSPLPSSSPLVPRHSSVVPLALNSPSENHHEHEQLHLPLAPATSPRAVGFPNFKLKHNV